MIERNHVAAARDRPNRKRGCAVDSQLASAGGNFPNGRTILRGAHTVREFRLAQSERGGPVRKVLLRQSRLVAEETVVHFPEFALVAGASRRDSGRQRVWMDRKR